MTSRYDLPRSARITPVSIRIQLDMEKFICILWPHNA